MAEDLEKMKERFGIEKEGIDETKHAYQELMRSIKEVAGVSDESIIKTRKGLQDLVGDILESLTDIGKIPRGVQGALNDLVKQIGEVDITKIVDREQAMEVNTSLRSIQREMGRLFDTIRSESPEILRVRFARLTTRAKELTSEIEGASGPFKSFNRSIDSVIESVSVVTRNLKDIDPSKATELTQALQEISDPEILKRPIEDIVNLQSRLNSLLVSAGKSYEKAGMDSAQIAIELKDAQESVTGIGKGLPDIERAKGAGAPADVMRGVGGLPGLEMAGQLGGLMAGAGVLATVMDAVTSMIKVMDSYTNRMLEAQRLMAAPGVVPTAEAGFGVMVETAAAIVGAGMPQVAKEEIEKIIHPQIQYAAELFVKVSEDTLTSSEQLLDIMQKAMVDPEKYGKILEDTIARTSVQLLKFSEATGMSVEGTVRSFRDLARVGVITTASYEEGAPILTEFMIGAKDAVVSMEDYTKWIDQSYRLLRFFSMNIHEAHGIVHRWSDELKAGIITVDDLNQAMRMAKGVMPMEQLALRFELLSNVIRDQGSPALQRMFDYIGKQGPEGLQVFFRSLMEGKDAMNTLRDMYPGVYEGMEKEMGGRKELERLSKELGDLQKTAVDEFYKALGMTTPALRAFGDMLGLFPGMPKAEAMPIEQWGVKMDVYNDTLLGLKSETGEFHKEAEDYLNRIKELTEDLDFRRTVLAGWARLEDWVKDNADLTKAIKEFIQVSGPVGLAWKWSEFIWTKTKEAIIGGERK